MSYKNGQLLKVKAASISFTKAPDALQAEGNSNDGNEEEVSIEITEDNIVMVVSTRTESENSYIKVLYESALYERKVWGSYKEDWFTQIETK